LAAYEAVILFYVLSGYVLTRPYFQGRLFNYPVFLTKRVFRIYPAYWAALFSAVLFMAWLSRASLPGLSSYVNGVVWHDSSWSSFWHHLTILLIRIPEDSEMYNPVVWTLKYEVVFSLLCPVILFVSKRLDGKISCCLFFAASCLGNLFSGLRFMRYLFMFGIGVNLAKHAQDLKKAYSKFFLHAGWFLPASAFFLYTAQWWGFWPIVMPRWLILFHDVLITGGAVLFILLALYSKRLSAFLGSPPVYFLGKVSYSLFLFQFPVILTMIYAFYGKIPLGGILLLSLALLLLVAALSYRWIELPALKKGNEISKRIYKQAPGAR